MDQPKEIRKQRSIARLRKKRFNLLKWFKGSRRKSVQLTPVEPPPEPELDSPDPVSCSGLGWISRMGLPLRSKGEAISTGPSETDSEGPTTPKSSPFELGRKGISFEEKRDMLQRRTSTLLNLAKRPFSSHANPEPRTPYPISMSMDCDRYLTKDAALRQLRDIRSFDDMILNGFNATCPEEPRSLTVTFSITPPLRSESEL